MKKLVIAFFACLMLVSTVGFARTQPANVNSFDWDYFGLPALDEGQKVKLDKIRIKYVSELIPLRSQLLAGDGALRVMMTVVPIDQAAFKAKLDELTGVLKAITGLEVRLIADVSAVLKDGAQKNEMFVRILSPNQILSSLADGFGLEQKGEQQGGAPVGGAVEQSGNNGPAVATVNSDKQDKGDKKSDKEGGTKTCGGDTRGQDAPAMTGSCNAPKK